MRLLVTANELWENVWASVGDFVSNGTVQNIWAALDNAAVGIFIIVFFRNTGQQTPNPNAIGTHDNRFCFPVFPVLPPRPTVRPRAEPDLTAGHTK